LTLLKATIVALPLFAARRPSPPPRHGHRQRLLAIDVLAGLKRGHRHLMMEVVRRGDVDDVDLGILDQLPPVAGGALEAEAGGGALAVGWSRSASSAGTGRGRSG
jgi:hypothetical protein